MRLARPAALAAAVLVLAAAVPASAAASKPPAHPAPKPQTVCVNILTGAVRVPPPCRRGEVAAVFLVDAGKGRAWWDGSVKGVPVLHIAPTRPAPRPTVTPVPDPSYTHTAQPPRPPWK